MMHRRISAFLAAAALGVAIAIPPRGYADDLDIYISPAGGGQEIIKPNVLLVLDTSDSMNVKVPNTGADKSDGATADDNSRLEEMRTAMVGLVQNLDNVNVGLMKFNGHRDPKNPGPVGGGYVATGGPVIFPIKDLDDSIFTVAGEAGAGAITLLTQVSASADDAEELLDASVTVTDFNINLGRRADVEITQYISASSDDGFQEFPTPGTVVINPSKPRGDRVVFARDDFIGLRFPGIDIPKDAVIGEATLSFVAQFTQTGITDTDVEIRGVLLTAGDISTFTDTDDLFKDLGPTTTAAVPWDIPAWNAGEAYVFGITTTPDLKDIVQELVEQADWAAGKPIAFRITDESVSDAGSERRAGKTFDHVDHDPTDADADGLPDNPASPRLHITHALPSEPETVGIRFEGVRVPQGVSITSAFIDFIAKDPTTITNEDPSSLTISVENVDDSAQFSAVAGDISGRSWTGSVAWTPDVVPPPDPEAETDDFTLSTVDVKSLVQTVVDKSYDSATDTGWCGGNAMSFRFTGAGQRVVHSFDSDPTKAPVLRMTFDQSGITAGQGCIVNSYVFQIAHIKDDATEQTNTSAVGLNGATLVANRGKNDPAKPEFVTGLRFLGVTLEPTDKILSAAIEMTASAPRSGPVTVTIEGEDDGDPLRFVNTATNITARARTAATVAWSPEDLSTEDVFETADISAIVQELIGHPDWASKQAMAFLISPETPGATLNGRRFYSFNSDVFKSPRLRVISRQFIGGTTGPKTVRQRLIELVEQQIFTLNRTPSIETLYEAARYWRGEAMEYGKLRCCTTDLDATFPDEMRYARVSHPGSYIGGTVMREAGCTDDNLNAVACASEFVADSPVYISPFENQECQNNYMIFLSDGGPTQNGAIAQVEALLPDEFLTGGACATDNTKGLNGRCGKDLLKYLKEGDQDDSDGPEVLTTVTTYTIGFNLGGADEDFMVELAAAGGGTFETASTAAQLTTVLTEIFSTILTATSSFASPALSVNAFNKLFTRDDVYFALFRPDTATRWNGNIKKFKICSDPDPDVCDLGEVIDADAESAVDEEDGTLLEGARSIWTIGFDDGPAIEKGGQGDQVPEFDGTAPDQRILYTDEGLAAVPSPAAELSEDAQKMTADTTGGNSYLTHANFREACATPDVTVLPGVDNTACDNLMLWMLGKHELNLDDTKRPAPLDDHRWSVHDPLHSSPIVVTYGAIDGDITTPPIDKLFVGSNDGYLHMINADDGTTEWSFVASEMLDVQQTLVTNADNTDHTYGLDLTPALHIADLDGDGKVEPEDDGTGDHVYLYVGMRRGGSSFYALEVTPNDGEITDNDVGLIEPKFLWRLSASAVLGSDTERLGQTWSRPQVVDIHFGTTGAAKTVLIFGGGYEPLLDDGFGTAPTGGSPNIGNAIFIVDPDDGSVIRWFSSDTDADIVVPKMDKSIVADVSTLDSDGDGLVDRVYVADMGGQIWRVDLGPTLSATDNGGTVVGRLAAISTAAADADPVGTLTDERRFMNAVDVVQVRDFEFTNAGNERYDLVTLTSGNRANPLNEDVQNRIYAIRDKFPDGMTDIDPPLGLADNYPRGGPTDPTDPISHTNTGDLVDVTLNLLVEGDDSQRDQVETALKDGFGWFIDLETSGEKGLSKPVILAGKLFVTTFVPAQNQDPCKAAEGEGKLYGLAVLSGEAVIDWDDLSTDLTKADRVLVLGSGIPSGAVPIFQEAGITLLIGTGGGAASVDPGVALPRIRSYWFEQDV